MSNLPANPLQSLIGRAAQELPATTGAVEPYYERLRRIGGRDTVVLADVSGSMAAPAWGGRTKHSVLRDALAATMRAAHHRLDPAGLRADLSRLPVHQPFRLHA